jgi:hypothetical protein
MATPSTTSPSRSHDARLRLSEAAGGRLDGAWWPRSRDIAAELPGLVDHFPVAAGHVDRVVFSSPDWSSCPRKVDVQRGRIKTGSFPSDDTHLLVLQLSTRAQLALLVVPPDTEPDVAHRLMARAAAADNRSTASEVLATGGQSVRDRTERPHDEYDDPDEGGEG